MGLGLFDPQEQRWEMENKPVGLNRRLSLTASLVGAGARRIGERVLAKGSDQSSGQASPVHLGAIVGSFKSGANNPVNIESSRSGEPPSLRGKQYA
jgi:hypothetical protein